jgi:hypothetical protein
MSVAQKHWLALVIAIAGPALMTALVELAKVEPAWSWLGLITPIIGTLIAKYTSAPQDAAKMARFEAALGHARADELSRGVGTGPQRGFVDMRALVIWVPSGACFVVAAVLGLRVLTGCGPNGTVNVPPTVIDTGVCIIDVVSKDLLAGDNIAVALADAAVRCLGGASAPNVAQAQALWSAHLAAEAREAAMKDGGK